MEECKKRQPVSVAEAKEILGSGSPDDLNQIQRWTLDYASKFTDLEGAEARSKREALVKECELTEEEAVEIVNIQPTSLAELRAFTFGWKKLILAETLERILAILKG